MIRTCGTKRGIEPLPHNALQALINPTRTNDSRFVQSGSPRETATWPLFHIAIEAAISRLIAPTLFPKRPIDAPRLSDIREKSGLVDLHDEKLNLGAQGHRRKGERALEITDISV